MWPPTQWQHNLTLTSTHPEAAVAAVCPGGRKTVPPSCHHTEPSWVPLLRMLDGS